MDEFEGCEIYKDIRYLTGETKISGKTYPTLKVWKIRARYYNPFLNYYYQSTERRDEELERVKTNADSRIEEKEKIKEAGKNLPNPYKGKRVE